MNFLIWVKPVECGSILHVITDKRNRRKGGRGRREGGNEEEREGEEREGE